MKTRAFLFAVAFALALTRAPAQDPTGEESAQTTYSAQSENRALRRENAKLRQLLKEKGGVATQEVARAVSDAELKSENDSLRRENQNLRRDLVTNRRAQGETPLPEHADDASPPARIESAEAETGYWLTTKSKVRHNSRCRNYRRVKGRPCGPKDGRPCKKCGG